LSATAIIRRRIVSPTNGLNPMDENTPDFATNLTLWEGKKLFYIRYLGGGCVGSPKLTCLSLQNGEMQGDFAKLQGERRPIPAEGPRISMGWIGLSLIQGGGRPSFHSREGRCRNSVRRCSSATFTQFSSMSASGAPFGHRRMARSPTDPKRTFWCCFGEKGFVQPLRVTITIGALGL
jgi:hypothetical protein